MDSVRHYRQRIDDPALKQEIQGFIGQEAMHSREHLAYNDLLQAAGLPAHRLDRRLKFFLDLQKKHLPPAFNLAVTIALEHYTAMLAEILLSDPSRFGDSLKGYQQMWYWHALEETEHKAVAFDVWNRVIKPGPCAHLLRTGSMLTTTLLFWLVVFDFHLRLLIADRKAGGHVQGFWRMLSFVWTQGHVPADAAAVAALLQAGLSSVGPRQPCAPGEDRGLGRRDRTDPARIPIGPSLDPPRTQPGTAPRPP